MGFSSIRVKAIILLILIGAIPGIILITIGAVDIGANIKREIQDDNLMDARHLSIMAGAYVDNGMRAPDSIRMDDGFVTAALKENSAAMDAELNSIFVKDSPFYNIAFIDENGTLLASDPLDTPPAMKKPDVMALVLSSYKRDETIASPANDTEQGVRYVDLIVPYYDDTGKFQGAIVGPLRLDNLSRMIEAAGSRHETEAVLVDRNGNVIHHENASVISMGMDESLVPVMGMVKQGRTGTIEMYDSLEGEDEYAAHWYNPELGWGAVIEFDKGIMNDVMLDMMKRYVLITISIIGIVGVLAYHVGSVITRPIEDMAKACMSPDESEAGLPVGRKDEIGTLARSIHDMSSALIKSRDRAELYVDLMSHDINNMNQSVRGFIELSLLSPGLPDEARLYLGKALRSVQSSSSVIEGVKKLQRVRIEGVSLESVNLYDVVRHAADESLVNPGKPVDVRFHGETEAAVKASPLLKEVFTNIMGNSIKYSGDSVTIDVTIMKKWLNEKEYYCVSLCDDGPGIPDDLKARLFQRYQRGTDRVHGTGLGLYLVKNILESLGGWAEIRDRIQGDYRGGACFDVCLAAHEPKNF